MNRLNGYSMAINADEDAAGYEQQYHASELVYRVVVPRHWKRHALFVCNDTANVLSLHRTNYGV